MWPFAAAQSCQPTHHSLIFLVPQQHSEAFLCILMHAVSIVCIHMAIDQVAYDYLYMHDQNV